MRAGSSPPSATRTRRASHRWWTVYEYDSTVTSGVFSASGDSGVIC